MLNNSKRTELTYGLTQKIFIPSGGDEIINLPLAITYNHELSHYGFSLTLDGIRRLATNSKEDIVSITRDISQVFDKTLGISDFKSSHPFYPDFPEQVMETEEAELYFNALVYYLFAQTDSPELTEIANELREQLVGEAQIQREPLPEDKIAENLKMLMPADEKELEKALYHYIMGPNLSLIQHEYLLEYARAEKNWYINIFGSENVSIPSHETLVKVAMELYKQNDVKNAKKLLNKAEDVLRFAAVLSHETAMTKNHDKMKEYAEKNRGKRYVPPLVLNDRDYMDANLSFGIKNNKKLFMLTGPQKKFVKTMLENCNDLYFSIWQREAMWKKLMPRLDTNDKKFPRVKRAFDNLHNNEKVLENGTPIRLSGDRMLNDVIDTIRKIGFRAPTMLILDSYMKQYPSHFKRNVERLAREEYIPADIIATGIREYLKDMPENEMLALRNHIRMVNNLEYRIITSKSGRNTALQNDLPKIPEEKILKITNAIDENVKESLSRGENKKFYIDPELYGQKLSKRNSRTASKGAVLNKYSEIKGREDKNILAFGIFWKNQGDERADIDLSASAFDETGKELCHVYYGDLRHEYMVHSGDYTNGMISAKINGAEEFVFADKNELKNHGVKYVIPFVHGFNRNFSEAESVRFMFMEKDGTLDMASSFDSCDYDKVPSFNGELIEPSEIEMSYVLTQESNMATPFIYDVENDRCVWIDSTKELRGIPNIANENSINETAKIFYEAFHNDYVDMAEFASIYAEANGSIVNDIHDADVIISSKPVDKTALCLEENVEIIMPYEINKLMEKPAPAEKEEKNKEVIKEKVEDIKKEVNEIEKKEEKKINFATDKNYSINEVLDKLTEQNKKNKKENTGDKEEKEKEER